MLKKTKKLVVLFLFLPTYLYGQIPPPLGAASSFVIYTAVGAVTNAGFSQITGNIGTNVGAVTGFGNINGVVHIADATAAACVTDVNIARDNINLQPPGTIHALTLGAGEVLTPAIYDLGGASTFTGSITLDGGGDPNACFIFRIDGAFAAAAASTVILTNGTQACNVFWRVDGATAIATNSIWRGTLIVNGATALATGCRLEGRLLNVTGAIDVSNFTGGPPLGCGSPLFYGPISPSINTLCDFALFTSLGNATNSGSTTIAGDVGSNSGTVAGFNPVGVLGTIHPTPDAATGQAVLDLNTLHTYVSGLTYDIELLFPALFGHSQVLTPHVYVLNAATTLTDTIFLDARGIPGAVFVIRILGALTTGVSPQVILVGGTEPENVYWQVEGAATVSSGGNFNGIIMANNAAIILDSGVILNGKVLSTNGFITTQNVNITTIICPLPLPIELLSFTATAGDKDVTLNWVTASENNNDYFNIERSSDGINFNSISRTEGAGNSSEIINYSSLDDLPLGGVSYYRLKQTDYNGETQYSNSVPVEYNPRNELMFNIYPNPFSGETTFHATKNLTGSCLIIHNSYGQIVQETTPITEQIFTLNCENLPSGLYFISVIKDGNVLATDRLVVNN